MCYETEYRGNTVIILGKGSVNHARPVECCYAFGNVECTTSGQIHGHVSQELHEGQRLCSHCLSALNHLARQ
jgi:hypothetical protein